jgi:hypothetical protein
MGRRFRSLSAEFHGLRTRRGLPHTLKMRFVPGGPAMMDLPRKFVEPLQLALELPDYEIEHPGGFMEAVADLLADCRIVACSRGKFLLKKFPPPLQLLMKDS